MNIGGGGDCAGHHMAALVGRVSQARMQPASVVGGPEDARRAVVPSMELPEDIGAGDLMVVAGTGAYHHRPDLFVGRPPVLGVDGGLVRTFVRRESLEDVLRRTN